jgi:hypothetical protein
MATSRKSPSARSQAIDNPDRADLDDPASFVDDPIANRHSKPDLFVAERDHRVHARCPPGGKVTGGEPRNATPPRRPLYVGQIQRIVLRRS